MHDVFFRLRLRIQMPKLNLTCAKSFVFLLKLVEMDKFSVLLDFFILKQLRNDNKWIIKFIIK
jgi:hypothetical protein